MKKKKKKPSPSPNSSTNRSNVDDFHPDPLVEGDCKIFDTCRTFCVRDQSIQYTFREHYLFFSWENQKSRHYTPQCPPAAYHLEKRPDLSKFDFFQFRKDHKKVRFYRYALEHNMCEDLLEYISENMEADTIAKFRQSLEDLRQSKLLVDLKSQNTTKSDKLNITPLFQQSCPLIGWKYVESRPSQQHDNKTIDDFTSWFNNLSDPLVEEVSDDLHRFISVKEEKSSNILDNLKSTQFALRYESVADISCVVKLTGSLISKYFNKYGTKFKFAICASPGFGKTRLISIFRQFLLTDVDDISINDPNEARLFHQLVQKREWDKQKLEYYRVIRTKFKEGVILCQNSDQVPPEIPYLNIVSPGHIGRRKLWSDRGLYDLVIKNDFKIFLSSKLERNSLVEVVYSEIYNSFNYVSFSDSC